MDVFELAFFDLFEEIVLAFGPEWVVSLKNNKKEDTQTPQISVDWHVISF